MRLTPEDQAINDARIVNAGTTFRPMYRAAVMQKVAHTADSIDAELMLNSVMCGKYAFYGDDTEFLLDL